MSDIKIQPSATGSATVTLTAPVSNTARTITLPDSTGTLINTGSDLPAAQLTGTVADARISALTASKLTGALPAISGASLTTLNATNLGSGTVPTARLGSGSPGSSNFLRGDGSWQTAGSTSASDLSSGTLPMARLSGTLPALNGSALTNISAGKVLQVVSTNMDDVTTHASGNWHDITGLAVTLTPAATSSKILIMLDTNTGTTASGGNLYAHGRILMSGGATGTSFLGTDPSNNTIVANFSFANGQHAYTKQYSVSWHAWYVPNTTSATTWQAQVYSGGQTIIVNGCGEDDNHVNNGRYSSTITAIEIGA